MKKRTLPIKTIYYEDETKDEFSSAVITPKRIDETWRYVRGGFFWRVKRFFLYRLIAHPIGYFYCRIRLGWRLKNKKVLKSIKGKKRGYFLYGNHTQQTADAFIPSFVSFPKPAYVIVHANNVSIPVLGRITSYMGALPLPDTLRAARNFKGAVATRFFQGNALFIYPEAHIWPYCAWIRNFPSASFRYPVELNAPCFCVTTTYQTRKFRKKPRAVTYVDGPFYPDATLPIKQRTQKLRNEIYEKMQERSRLNTCEYIRYQKGRGEMNVLYCGNKKVFDGVLTSSLSLVMRLSVPRPLRIYLFTMDLTRLNPEYTAIEKARASQIERALQKFNPDTKVLLCDVTNLYETLLKGNANEGCYCSPYTLLRLLADLIDMPDRVLYLDADILFQRDPALLYDTEIEGYEYAAARDHYGKYLVSPNYINAGVLLFNMSKCKETGLFEKARSLLCRKKLPFADQSALLRVTTKKKMLPQRFNDQKFLHKRTVVRHFSKRLFWLPYPHTDNVKQWQVERVKKVFKYTAFDDIFSEYLAQKSVFEKE